MRLAALPGLPNPTKNHKMLSNGEEEKKTTYKQEHRRITDGQWQREAPLGLPGRTLRRPHRHCSGRLSVHILSAISRVIKIPLPTRLNPPTHRHTTHTPTYIGRASAFKHFNLPMWPQLLPPRRHRRRTLDLGTSPGYSARQAVVSHSFASKDQECSESENNNGF